jgi:hypothetical protein
MFNLKTSVKVAPKLKRTVFVYRKGNFDELRDTLDSLDLCDVIYVESGCRTRLVEMEGAIS